MKTFEKDPNSKLDYSIDWAPWLGSDTIEESVWIVPVGVKRTHSSFDATSSTVWLEGGALGRSYKVTNRVKTSGGRTDDRSFAITIVNR